MDENRQYSVELNKEQLVFSAAHFITFGDDNVCESLHGHNYGVRCSVQGRLNHQGYVIDFIALRDSLAGIVRRLDHKVLLPGQHPTISVSCENGEVVARFQDRRWIFPAADCMILPVANTTAELLAGYIAGELLASLGPHAAELSGFSVGVDENHGQWGTAGIRIRNPDLRA